MFQNFRKIFFFLRVVGLSKKKKLDIFLLKMACLWWNSNVKEAAFLIGLPEKFGPLLEEG